MADHPPLEVAELIHQLGVSPPYKLLDVLRGYLAAERDIGAVNLLLADYGEDVLVPLSPYQGPPLDPQPVGTGQAGMAYRTRTVQVGEVQDGWRVCVPVSLRAERLGVLDVLSASEPSRTLVNDLERLTLAVAFALLEAGQSTDAVELARRRRPLSLPAEMQWELLPRLAFQVPEYMVAGTVEPAYEVGGDAFDYAVQPRALTMSITDAMGHGLQAALLAGLAVAALRNTRRRLAGPLEQVNQANQALYGQFGGERFVTGQVLRFDVPGGTGVIVNAGHPPPLRIRDGRVEQLALDADLPMGLYPQTVYHLQRLTLERGDRLVLLSDGVLDAAPEGGSAYGAARLEAVLHGSRALAPYEVVRLAVREVVAHRAGDLADDLTLVCLDWGPPAA